MDGEVVCWSQRFGGEDLICGAWFTSPERRGRSCWTRGNKLRSDRVHSFAGTPGPSRQPVGLDGCVQQETREMRRHHELLPLSCIISCIDRSQRGKAQDERKEERNYYHQPMSRTDCRGC